MVLAGVTVTVLLSLPIRTAPPPLAPETSTVAPDNTTSRPNRSMAPPKDPVARWRPLLYRRPVLPPSMLRCPAGPEALLADITAAVVAIYDPVKAICT